MTTVGYARTSTADQVAGLADQVATLTAAGATRIWQEHVSALATDRPELAACLGWVREGDTFIVTKPDRLARSVPGLLDTVSGLQGRGVNVRILSMGVDTSTPTGKLILTVLGGVAAWEREIMLERQRAGIAAAQREGKYKGRKAVMTPQRTIEARLLLAQGQSRAAVARWAGVDASTLYRALKR